MRKIKKLLAATFVAGFCSLCFMFPVSASGIENVTAVMTEETQISPRRDELEWVFKFENGKTYRRCWNATRGEWVTGWELVE